MCSPTLAVTAVLGAYSAQQQSQARKKAAQDQRRIAQQQQAAQARSIQLENNQRQREIAGQSQRAEQIKAALGGSAANSQQFQEQIVEANKEKSEAQLKALDVNQELTGEKLDDRLTTAAAVREDSYVDDIDASAAEGLQDAGSGVQGNVSEAFNDASAQAKQSGINEAKTNAKDASLLGGYADATFQENQLVGDANVESGLAINNANSLLRGAELLRNAQQQQTQAALTGADLSALVAPQKTELFDIDPAGDYSAYTNRAAIAQGLAGYAPYLNFQQKPSVSPGQSIPALQSRTSIRGYGQ